MGYDEKMVKVYDCHCLRCGHKWQSYRSKVPSICPNCARKYWWKPGNKIKGTKPHEEKESEPSINRKVKIE